MELKFEVNEQEIVDKVLEIVKDEFIPKSVIEDIKAEIEEEADGSMGSIGDGYYNALTIIDKHINGKENNERPCNKCIFHDGICHHWNCEPITRNEAEAAVKTLRDLAKTCEPHYMVCVGDIVKGVQNEN